MLLGLFGDSDLRVVARRAARTQGTAGSGQRRRVVELAATRLFRNPLSSRYALCARIEPEKETQPMSVSTQARALVYYAVVSADWLPCIKQGRRSDYTARAEPRCMHLRIALAAGLLLLAVSDKVVAQSFVPQGYQLTFSEEFTRLSLDACCTRDGTWATYWCKWNIRNLSGNNDRALKANPSFRGTGGPTLAEHGLVTHERTVGNTLNLYGRVIPILIRSQYYNFSYVGGMISTERTHAQTYGYWEVRARFTNTSRGHHWAMWLIPQDGSWPPEIDMVEVVGENPNRFYMNSHGDKRPLTWFSPDDPSGWHTWGFLWTQNDLVWYVDGVERKRISNYINKPMYLVISPEIGNSWAGSTDGSTVWPMEAEVDYVRVYEVGSAPSYDATAPSIRPTLPRQRARQQKEGAAELGGRAACDR
jgi:hypothetical protein